MRVLGPDETFSLAYWVGTWDTGDLDSLSGSSVYSKVNCRPSRRSLLSPSLNIATTSCLALIEVDNIADKIILHTESVATIDLVLSLKKTTGLIHDPDSLSKIYVSFVGTD